MPKHKLKFLLIHMYTIEQHLSNGAGRHIGTHHVNERKIKHYSILPTKPPILQYFTIL